MDAREDVKILVVDDEDYMREIVRRALEDAAFSVEEAADGKAALQMIRRYPYDVIITDLRMPGCSGREDPGGGAFDLSRNDRDHHDGLRKYPDRRRSHSVGAYDYLPKPFQLDELVMRVEKGLQERQLKSENSLLRSELHEKYQSSNLVGNSAAMQQIYRMVTLVADKTSTVLITGETGTGKELIARAIHYSGPRKNQPLVCVNCGAIPSNLLEDELFGHVKGAFTGAHQHGSEGSNRPTTERCSWTKWATCRLISR